MSNNMKKQSVFRLLSLILSLILVVSFAATSAGIEYEGFLNDQLQVQTTRVVVDDGETGTEYYKSDYATVEELYEAKMDLIQEIVSEGVVLLKNENNALPLAEEKNVSVFGRNSVKMVQGISGGASVIDPGRSDELTKVFESVGVSVNPILYDFYKNVDSDKYNASWGGTLRIGEVPVSEYTTEVQSSYAQYKDAAIIVLSRSNGEGHDFSLDPASVIDGDGVHHGLQIQENERQMIAEAKNNFSKVIVLINSDYAMEIDELKNDTEIDAILWIGGTGYNGIYGAVDVIVGKTSPSGHLADTYAVNVGSSPAAQGTGDHVYSNVKEDIQAHYTVYQEGIYVGYKYYETRYEDCVLGRYNANSQKGTYGSNGEWNYRQEVSYPFGYGLSYSTFTEEVTNLNVEGTTATMEVVVTNIGNYDSKHVVQVYAQSPYTEYDIENKVEKAAVQLVGFEKTDVLEKNGGKQTITVEIDLHNLASYDYTKAKTYIMEAGTYYFAIGNGAHDALNNILAAKGMSTKDGMDYEGDLSKAKTLVMEKDDFETYATSVQTGYEITNQLENADLNYYGDFITYLSRSDWEATWPVILDDLTATDEMVADLKNGSTYTPTEATEEDKAKMAYGSEETAYPLIMLKGVPFDSEYWNELLNQLTLEEMSHLVGASGGALIPCESIMFAGNVMRDGPAGVKASYTSGECAGENSVMFQSEVILASTFSPELAYAQGEMFGNDALYLNTHMAYAPGSNIHRTPLSGRNSEYLSEDAVLTSIMSVNEVEGAYQYGLIMAPKHFAFNDQETHRNGLGTFFNEQEAREIMLRAFESAMSSSLGTMSAYNRVGCIYSSAHEGLMQEILRNEWGFKGIVISDAVGSRILASYADGPAGVYCGLSVFNTNVDTLYCGPNGTLNAEAIIEDPVLFEAVKKACHYNLYASVNSSAINGYTSNMRLEQVTPYWKVAIFAVDGVVGALLLLSLGGYLYFGFKEKERKKA